MFRESWFDLAHQRTLEGAFHILQLVTMDLVGNFSIGLGVILIAWIMNEGREIQEEQTLTV